MKKKYVLKSWVKEALNIIVFIALMLLCLVLINRTGTEAIEDCMNAGHSQTYCESNL